MPRIRDSQIMFRVYDEKVDEMVGSHMHVFGESTAFGRVESWIKNHREAKGDETILERFNDMVVMQYIGLRDATGWEELTDKEKDKWYNKEEDWLGRFIWEGDIINWSGEKFQVIIKHGHPRAKSKELNAYIYTDYLERIEVIGNKFEDNPELLEAQ